MHLTLPRMEGSEMSLDQQEKFTCDLDETSDSNKIEAKDRLLDESQMTNDVSTKTLNTDISDIQTQSTITLVNSLGNVLEPENLEAENAERDALWQAASSSIQDESMTSSQNRMTDEELARRLECEASRPVRKTRKRHSTDHVTCPVCHMRLARDSANEHVDIEAARLGKWLQQYIRKSERRQSSDPGASTSSSRCSLSADQTNPEATRAARYQTYQRVKRNRLRRGPGRRHEGEGVECPVCGERVAGTQEQLNTHVNLCLAKAESCDVDVEGGGSDSGGEAPLPDSLGGQSDSDAGSLEEYEWAGQTRVRVAAGARLARAGWAVARHHKRRKRGGGGDGQNGGEARGGGSGVESSDEEDLELDIEQDSSQQYGLPQYGEGDLVPCAADEPSEERQRRALREALLTGEERDGSQTGVSEAGSSKWGSINGNTDNHTNSQTETQPDTEPNTDPCSHISGADPGVIDHKQLMCSTKTSSTVIESLKLKIREMEKMLEKAHRFRCLICMEPYDRPVTSVQCWHVYCEECWLRTLGMKKLCPQCNMITHPGDLRKIYL